MYRVNDIVPASRASNELANNNPKSNDFFDSWFLSNMFFFFLYYLEYLFFVKSITKMSERKRIVDSGK